MEFAAAPTLAGTRVTLEPLDPGHAAELSIAVADGELWRTWYTAVPRPEVMATEIDRRLALAASGQMMPWGIRSASTGAMVGMTTFMHPSPDQQRLEIGSTWLGKGAQGTGANREAKLLLLGYAFEELDCIAVEFRTHWHNRQSRAAIAALGAKQDGVLRSHSVGPEGAVRDTVVFSIIAAEWPAVRLGLREGLARHAALAETPGA
ncbi:GNAT family N-acetyltransferase [Cryobacterium breve]|jgi:RimJ/RimL family protein N-acetyltransferase|uniref:GNAT family N-acetyltransferase n=1 Tax=Cryobacterium breve TaxID=1259258 RepID=A0ABY7NG71_9MICO|nr:GNAT family protein [Cryobacterium breve]WBM80534.1 GNAT family N-acetyltransferase [Cryobacterium breve]